MAFKRYPQIMHTWVYGPMPFERVARSLHDIGVVGADLGFNLDSPVINPDALAKVDVKGILADHNLKALCATPLYNRPDLDMSHPDPKVREHAVDFTLRAMDVARAAGADRMMIAPSAFSATKSNTLHTGYDEDWERAAATVAKVAEEAAKRDMLVLIEPINRFRVTLVNTVPTALRLIRQVGLPNLGIAADTYHMNMEEDRSVASAILGTEGYLRCLHIADNNRQPAGFGSLDWKSILLALAKIGFDGPLALEPVYRGFSDRRLLDDADYHALFVKMMAHGVKTVERVMETLDADAWPGSV